MSAGSIGYGKQCFPAVGVTVDYLARHIRHCDAVSRGSRPGAEFVAQLFALFGMVTAALGSYLLVRSPPLHPDDDRAAEYRVRECAETGKRHWGEGG